MKGSIFSENVKKGPIVTKMDPIKSSQLIFGHVCIFFNCLLYRVQFNNTEALIFFPYEMVINFRTAAIPLILGFLA